MSLHALVAITSLTEDITSAQAKQAAAAKEKQAAKPNTPALAEDEGEQLDPNQYFEMRVKALNATKSSGKNPYPHKFAVGCSIPAFLDQWKGLASGEQRLDETDLESVAGTTMMISIFAGCTVSQLQVCSSSLHMHSKHHHGIGTLLPLMPSGSLLEPMQVRILMAG